MSAILDIGGDRYSCEKRYGDDRLPMRRNSEDSPPQNYGPTTTTFTSFTELSAPLGAGELGAQGGPACGIRTAHAEPDHPLTRLVWPKLKLRKIHGEKPPAQGR